MFRHAYGQLAPRPLSTVSTRYAVHYNFVHVRLDLRDLDNLMHARFAIRIHQLSTAATPASRWLHHGSPGNLLWWKQDAPVWLVPGLPAAFSSGGLLRRSRPRWVRRGWLVRVCGVLTKLGLQLRYTPLQTRNLRVPLLDDAHETLDLRLQSRKAIVGRAHARTRSRADLHVDPPSHMIT